MTSKERIAKLERDAVERRKIFKELCDHVASGKSLECFAPLSDQSVRNYLKLYPLEFVEEELIEAKRKGRDTWEELGIRQANGSCLGNSRTWYYNMANRYGWRERLDIEAEHKGNVQVQVVSYASKRPPQDTPSEH